MLNLRAFSPFSLDKYVIMIQMLFLEIKYLKKNHTIERIVINRN